MKYHLFCIAYCSWPTPVRGQPGRLDMGRASGALLQYARIHVHIYIYTYVYMLARFTLKDRPNPKPKNLSLSSSLSLSPKSKISLAASRSTVSRRSGLLRRTEKASMRPVPQCLKASVHAQDLSNDLEWPHNPEDRCMTS